MKTCKCALRFGTTWLAAASMVIVSGCASGPAFKGIEPAPAGKAVAYVYRPMSLPQAVNRYAIRFDGALVTPVELGNGTWTRMIVDPGRYLVHATGQVMFMTCAPASVALNAGDIAYIQLAIRMWGDGRQNYQSCQLVSTEEQGALRALSGLSQVAP